MLKKLIPLISLMLIVAAVFIIIRNKRNQSTAEFTIGILQTISHPALDQAREGFIAKLQETLGDRVAFVIKNADGSINNAQAIAKSFHLNKSIDGIFAIATPAAQAAARVEKAKPIFFAAISDPHAIGLVHPTTNACGATDLIDVKTQADALATFLPTVKHVAILFSPGEINSVSCMSNIKDELEKRSLNVTPVGITSETEIPTATHKATRIANALLIPTDNMLASAMPVIISITRKANKPVIVSDNLLVNQGATLSAGAANYTIAGQKAAECARKVLIEKQLPHELPLASSIDPRVFIHQERAQELGINIPKTITKDLVMIK